MSKDISEMSCITLPDNCCSTVMEKLQFSGVLRIWRRLILLMMSITVFRMVNMQSLITCCICTDDCYLYAFFISKMPFFNSAVLQCNSLGTYKGKFIDTIRIRNQEKVGTSVCLIDVSQVIKCTPYEKEDINQLELYFQKYIGGEMRMKEINVFFVSTVLRWYKTLPCFALYFFF